ncbi:MAG: PorT family protein [Saprospiraceae bacterium]|nr:PorT family protein [Saprospiraceae bacterium]
MHDKYDHHLADKGWQQMRQRLDSEMPEQTDRRKSPAAWWWITMLAMMAGGIWMSYEFGLRRGRLQNTPQQPVASADVQPGVTNTPQQPATLVLPPVKQQLSVSGIPLTSNWRLPQVFIAKSGETNNNAHQSVAPLPTLATQDGTSASEAEATTAIIPLPEKNIESVRSANIQQPSIAVQPISAEQTLAAEITPDRKASRWALGVTGQASTESFTNLNGISGGMTVNFQVNRQFGLRSGAMYSYYRPNTVSQPLVEVETPDYVQATKNYYFINNPAATPDESVFIPVQKLHRLEAPFLLFWQPFKHFQVFSGASLGYTFYGKSAEENFTEASVLRLGTTVAERGADRLVTNELHPWQTDFQGGFTYKIYQNWELGLSYKRPFSFQNTREARSSALLDITQPAQHFSSNRYLHQHLLNLSSTLFF